MFFVNEGYSTVQMVAGLQILSRGFWNKFLDSRKRNFQAKGRKSGGSSGHPKVATAKHANPEKTI
jgi:hypothetical protein